MILFLDLETTGLDPDRDSVLEIACILTDDKFVKLRTFATVVKYDLATTHPVSPIVVHMHTMNGLWRDCFAATGNIQSIDSEAASWLQRMSGDHPVHLAGNSIHFDRSFMAVHMPNTLALLHYRQIDTSSINELARRCWPDVYESRPAPQKGHRALADATEAWNTAVYYANRLSPVPA